MTRITYRQKIDELFTELDEIYELKNRSKSNRFAKALISSVVYELVKPHIKGPKKLKNYVEKCQKEGVGAARRSGEANPFILGFKSLKIEYNKRGDDWQDEELKNFLNKHLIMNSQTLINYSNVLMLMHAIQATATEVRDVLKEPNSTKLFEFYRHRQKKKTLPKCLSLNVGWLVQKQKDLESKEDLKVEVDRRIDLRLRRHSRALN